MSEWSEIQGRRRPVVLAALFVSVVVGLAACSGGHDATHSQPTVSPPQAAPAAASATHQHGTARAQAVTVQSETATTVVVPVPAIAPAWVHAAPNSHAIGLWRPRFATVNGMPSCSAELHNSFFVVGPDGRKYPTWHPPTMIDPATGKECTFGHEHGRDPKLSQLWRTAQIQRAFYFDANGSGRMDRDEQAWAGIPFGYVNEAADAWFDNNSIPSMRHEDHVGHKIEWANDETDIATHNMSTAKNTGVWVGQLGNGVMARDTGMRCFFLAKAHQGTSTPDAFRHNLHEVFYFQDCRHRNDLTQCRRRGDLSTCADTHPMNAKLSVAVLQAFGKAGGFTRFAPMCGLARRNDPRDFIDLGDSQHSAYYPDGPGDREIVTRDCVESGFLVSEPRFSGNPYEAWPASLAVRMANGQALVEGINLLFDVNDAARYFYPEDLKVLRGYDRQRPELAGTQMGYLQDLCYERLAGRRARHVMCDWSTDYGNLQGIGWDHPRAAFRGLHRGMYFQPGVLRNAAGPGTWYTDPFGGRAAVAPFPGSIRQSLTARSLSYSELIQGAPIDPRVAMRWHADGKGTVHAPN